MLDGPRVDRWHRRCGVGGHSSPPRARRPPGATIAFGRAVTVEESALMSRALTGGVGCVARWPTRRQVASALRRGRPVRRRDCVRLSLSLRRIPRRCLHDFGCFRSRCSIAHASTSGIGIAARASPPSLPPLPALIVVPLASRLRMSGSCGLSSPPPHPPAPLSINVNFCYCVLSFILSIMLLTPSPP